MEKWNDSTWKEQANEIVEFCHQNGREGLWDCNVNVIDPIYK